MTNNIEIESLEQIIQSYQGSSEANKINIISQWIKKNKQITTADAIKLIESAYDSEHKNIIITSFIKTKRETSLEDFNELANTINDKDDKVSITQYYAKNTTQAITQENVTSLINKINDINYGEQYRIIESYVGNKAQAITLEDFNKLINANTDIIKNKMYMITEVYFQNTTQAIAPQHVMSLNIDDENKYTIIAAYVGNKAQAISLEDFNQLNNTINDNGDKVYTTRAYVQNTTQAITPEDVNDLINKINDINDNHKFIMIKAYVANEAQTIAPQDVMGLIKKNNIANENKCMIIKAYVANKAQTIAQQDVMDLIKEIDNIYDDQNEINNIKAYYKYGIIKEYVLNKNNLNVDDICKLIIPNITDPNYMAAIYVSSNLPITKDNLLTLFNTPQPNEELFGKFLEKLISLCLCHKNENHINQIFNALKESDNCRFKYYITREYAKNTTQTISLEDVNSLISNIKDDISPEDKFKIKLAYVTNKNQTISPQDFNSLISNIKDDISPEDKFRITLAYINNRKETISPKDVNSLISNIKDISPEDKFKIKLAYVTNENQTISPQDFNSLISNIKDISPENKFKITLAYINNRKQTISPKDFNSLISNIKDDISPEDKFKIIKLYVGKNKLEIEDICSLIKDNKLSYAYNYIAEIYKDSKLLINQYNLKELRNNTANQEIFGDVLQELTNNRVINKDNIKEISLGDMITNRNVIHDFLSNLNLNLIKVDMQTFNVLCKNYLPNKYASLDSTIGNKDPDAFFIKDQLAKLKYDFSRCTVTQIIAYCDVYNIKLKDCIRDDIKKELLKNIKEDVEIKYFNHEELNKIESLIGTSTGIDNLVEHLKLIKISDVATALYNEYKPTIDQINGRESFTLQQRDDNGKIFEVQDAESQPGQDKLDLMVKDQENITFDNIKSLIAEILLYGDKENEEFKKAMGNQKNKDKLVDFFKQNIKLIAYSLEKDGPAILNTVLGIDDGCVANIAANFNHQLWGSLMKTEDKAVYQALSRNIIHLINANKTDKLGSSADTNFLILPVLKDYYLAPEALVRAIEYEELDNKITERESNGEQIIDFHVGNVIAKSSAGSVLTPKLKHITDSAPNIKDVIYSNEQMVAIAEATANILINNNNVKAKNKEAIMISILKNTIREKLIIAQDMMDVLIKNDSPEPVESNKNAILIGIIQKDIKKIYDLAELTADIIIEKNLAQGQSKDDIITDILKNSSIYDIFEKTVAIWGKEGQLDSGQKNDTDAIILAMFRENNPELLADILKSIYEPNQIKTNLDKNKFTQSCDDLSKISSTPTRLTKEQVAELQNDVKQSKTASEKQNSEFITGTKTEDNNTSWSVPNYNPTINDPNNIKRQRFSHTQHITRPSGNKFNNHSGSNTDIVMSYTIPRTRLQNQQKSNKQNDITVLHKLLDVDEKLIEDINVIIETPFFLKKYLDGIKLEITADELKAQLTANINAKSHQQR